MAKTFSRTRDPIEGMNQNLDVYSHVNELATNKRRESKGAKVLGSEHISTISREPRHRSRAQGLGETSQVLDPVLYPFPPAYQDRSRENEPSPDKKALRTRALAFAGLLAITAMSGLGPEADTPTRSHNGPTVSSVVPSSHPTDSVSGASR